MPLNIRIQWNAGTACASECVLKALACQGLHVGRSKLWPPISKGVPPGVPFHTGFTGSSKATSCGFWQKRVRVSDLLEGGV